MARRLFVLASIALCGISCTGGTDADLGAVTGTVTLDGAPYGNAHITFTPDSGRRSMGITDSDGKYELTYIKAQKGATPGTHKVSITTVPPETTDQDPGGRFAEPIPKKYNVKSTLSAQVEVGENSHDFPLTSK
ncbi:MAG: hypothetical protein COA78_33525 [Blastopirellula sp.]|nr:MAG: hypothetical protein COA78_33525 [Blastopirellula sp.]